MERQNKILLKVLLWSFIYVGMLFCLGNNSIYAMETCRIETASYILQASGFDEIFVMNKQSEKLVRLGSMRLGWSPAIAPKRVLMKWWRRMVVRLFVPVLRFPKEIAEDGKFGNAGAYGYLYSTSFCGRCPLYC